MKKNGVDLKESELVYGYSWIPLSGKYLYSANFFMLKCHEIEMSKTSKYPDVYGSHHAYTINSIISSVAFLETYINQFYCSLIDAPFPNQKKIVGKKLHRIQKMWAMGIPRTASYSIPKKYQIALILSDNVSFSDKDPIYQKIITITQLRNALIHYEPEWTELNEDPQIEREKIKKLGKKLQHEKFPSNPFVNDYMEFYPVRCLGYGCTKWVYDNSLNFVIEFENRMGIESTDLKEYKNTGAV